MVSSGSCARARPGETYLSAMAQSEPCRAGSIDGNKRAYGAASWQLCRRKQTRGARSTGTCTSWMPPLFAPISTPPVPAGLALLGGEEQDEALGRSQGGF